MQDPQPAPQQPARPMPAPPMPAPPMPESILTDMFSQVMNLLGQQAERASDWEAEWKRMQSERELERMRVESRRVQVDREKLEIEKMKLSAQQERDRAKERRSQIYKGLSCERSRLPSPAQLRRYEYRGSTTFLTRSSSRSPARSPIQASKRSRVAFILPSEETGNRGYGTSYSWTSDRGTILPATATAAPFVPTGPRQRLPNQPAPRLLHTHPTVAYRRAEEESKRQQEKVKEKTELTQQLAAKQVVLEAQKAELEALESSNAASLPSHEESSAPADASQPSSAPTFGDNPRSEEGSDQQQLDRQLHEELASALRHCEKTDDIHGPEDASGSMKKTD